jgi:two-component system chemotaxis sensor kinase CheA
LNKKVRLELFGEDTELDKRVIEMISDPLRHMVRNSVDHGIESIDERKQKGKPETGIIKLNAYHEEGNMVIEIMDDGRGLNKDIILKKAIEKGLYDPKTTTITEENDIYNFIFEPGFSTAETVSDLSGRGVGMDVVKNNIESIRGKIYVESQYGLGTTFKIVLPLTVSIIDGMIFRVGDKLFILPLLSINELIRPEDKMLKKVEGRSEVINLRGEFLPLLKLYEEFSIDANIKDPTKAIMLIIESEGRKYGLMVDELVGQQQVVIKPLDQMFEKVKGITGASILGNGKVALILDAPTLIRSSAVKSVSI